MTWYQRFISDLKEDGGSLLRILFLIGLALLVLGSCLIQSQARLPPEVHEMIERQYIHCVEVKGSEFVGGNQLEGECSRVTTEVVGEGLVPPHDQALGVVRAICYRAEYENPYFWAQSQTQYEEIDFATRTASKVTVLQNGEWVLFPDQELQDRERWAAYSCPGEYEITE